MSIGKRWRVSTGALLVGLFGCTVVAYAQSGLESKWIAYSRAGAPNSPSQCFAPDNVAVSDGNLVLTTKAETAACRSIDLPQGTHKYTSSFVAMRTFNFLYGTVEVRAKFGGGMNSGSWPTAWFLDASCQASDPTGTDDHCTGQEIDMAEILDGNFSQVNQQIHIDNFKHNDGCKPQVSDTSQNFHVYQMDWSVGSLVFKVDGKPTCTITKKFVPSAPMYLKFSVYVGGFGGQVKDSSLPWTTLIDFVKITQGPNVIFEDQFNGPPAAPRPPAKRKRKTAISH
jgi:beta-glucanase (GH16 family)